MARWSSPACLLAALLAVGCGDPPNREINQAQGAIDAARAAGADQYATAEYTAAVEALKSAQDAVGQRDYRLALDRAIESRERAQTAARDGANGKAQVRGEVERMMTEVATLVAQANVRLDAARKTRARELREPTEAVAEINAEMQKAGEAIRAGDYLSPKKRLADLKDRIQRVIAAIDEAMTRQPGRRRR
ncbi:MAG TPA: DUF4398 domain-containing protein [Vicinamibacterales bacterium]|nr:DUF4398 domain-containing protein [Vicinamibacterales bacterium]